MSKIYCTACDPGIGHNNECSEGTKMKEVIEIAWKRSDGLLRTSISFPVSGMVEASEIAEYLTMVIDRLLKPEGEKDESDEHYRYFGHA